MVWLVGFLCMLGIALADTLYRHRLVKTMSVHMLDHQRIRRCYMLHHYAQSLCASLTGSVLALCVTITWFPKLATTPFNTAIFVVSFMLGILQAEQHNKRLADAYGKYRTRRFS